MSELGEMVCICTNGHDPERRVECKYGERAAAAFLASSWLREHDARVWAQGYGSGFADRSERPTPARTPNPYRAGERR